MSKLNNVSQDDIAELFKDEAFVGFYNAFRADGKSHEEAFIAALERFQQTVFSNVNPAQQRSSVHEEKQWIVTGLRTAAVVGIGAVVSALLAG